MTAPLEHYVTFGATNPTWHVDMHHERHDSKDEPCRIEELTHFGEPGTGFLWCATHGAPAGFVAYPSFPQETPQ